MVANDLGSCTIGSGADTHEPDCTQHTFLEILMPTVETYVEVDVELTDFSDDDLIEEMESRGLALEYNSQTGTELITAIYHKRRLGQDYQRELDDLIYLGIGRIA